MNGNSTPLLYPNESASLCCDVILFWKAENCVLCVVLTIRSVVFQIECNTLMLMLLNSYELDY
jgi:hypothetical protein